MVKAHDSLAVEMITYLRRPSLVADELPEDAAEVLFASWIKNRDADSWTDLYAIAMVHGYTERKD